jgi:hypothetical protein
MFTPESTLDQPGPSVYAHTAEILQAQVFPKQLEHVAVGRFLGSRDIISKQSYSVALIMPPI